MTSTTIESNLQEQRLFQPPSKFSSTAYIKSIEEYQHLCDRALENPDRFWGELADSELQWFQPWDKVLDWQPPHAKWFVGGKLNITHNCLDRHLKSTTKNMPALVWQGEPGDSRTYTYAQLHQEVCQMANVLKQLGVTKGDRVGIYLPMIPEAAIAMLACARIGAVHSVIFAGFSAEAVKGRLLDAEAKVVITADVMYEGAPHAGNPGCLWDIVEQYGVTIFYTAPTAIRLLMTFGEELPLSKNLSKDKNSGGPGTP